ncbi:unnamed protein product [Paramecium octaurelia]|uniref:Calcium-dependent protein kinase n=1 Tax=Paramecium octaurelia TaxID=43137 RepID=A0A8S1X4U8_PAROT|nr:unnamed protein product [Paramecium octaurelia]
MGEKRIDKYLFNPKDLIGEGSYAQVYRGREEKTGVKVAIKVLNKSVINADDYLREGLISEIKVMQKLKSPNIVQLMDVMETNNNYYIIQEYCDSGDLDKLIENYVSQKKTMPEKDAVKFMIDILNGFIQLIKNGIIHRDLKPANILIDKGTFKLADFGFAKCVDNFKKDMLASLVGTPLYMSPQILDNKKYTSKTDIWSIAFIFYEALFGKTPWTARSPQELLKNIRNQPLQFKGPQISKEAQEFLTGCLQTEEKDRLSWDDIYRHPLFKGHFTDFIKNVSILEDKATYLINDIRQMIIKEQLDIGELFAELDMTKDKALNVNELGKFLTRVDKNLTREEIEYIFNKFDDDGNNLIEFNEFKKWLEENDCRMTASEVSRTKKKVSILLKPQQDIQAGSLDDRARIVIEKLKTSIVKYNINLLDLFNKYDKSANHELDVLELGKLLKRIDSSVTDEECKSIFSFFDHNKDGSVSFNEFEFVLKECLVKQKLKQQQ